MMIIAARRCLFDERFLARLGRRTIATRTTPTLSPKRRKTKKSKSTIHKSNDEGSNESSTQRRIRELRRQLNPSSDDDKTASSPPPKLAPTIEAIPLERTKYSSSEFDLEMSSLHLQVDQWISDAVGSTGIERIQRQDMKVRMGGMSNLEMIRFIRDSLPQIANVGDRRAIGRALQHYKDVNFDSMLEHVLEHDLQDPKETLDVIQEALSKPNLQDMAPMHERRMDIRLDELPPFRKRAYFHQKRELFAGLQQNHVTSGRGDSMLPTLWNPCYVVGKLWDESNGASCIEVGHVVTFVVLYKSGDTKLFGKRVRALEGDVVDYKDGKVVVPTGHFWAIGDNEAKSFDSRDFGAVPMLNLKKRHLMAFSLWPPRFRWL